MVFLLLIIWIFFTKPIFAADPVIKITDFSSDSNPEWIQLTNTTNENITLENWYFIDNSNTKKNIDIFCLSPSSNKVFEYNSGWLNNDGDSISLYNSTGTLIDKLTYSDSESKNQTTPSNTNTCLLPSPTTDPTVINPNSGISLTEFMPYTSFEWVEIYNDNNYDVKLNNWSLEDSSGKIYDINDFNIAPKEYKVINLKSYTLNDNGDSIILKDNNGQKLTTFTYGDDHYKSDKSWSYVFGSWCQANISAGSSNSTSCYTESTPTPTPTKIPTLSPTKSSTATPTIDLNRFDSSLSATPSVINEPIPSISDNSTTPSPSVLGDNNEITNISKTNFLPLVFIISGGVLLISPFIFSKFKKNEKDN